MLYGIILISNTSLKFYMIRIFNYLFLFIIYCSKILSSYLKLHTLQILHTLHTLQNINHPKKHN
jgi:hypothetical protein